MIGARSSIRDPELKRTSGYISTDIADFNNSPNFFDIGMVTLHEIQHGFFGLDYSPATLVATTKGAAVERVNVYERELGYPERVVYSGGGKRTGV